MNVRHLSFLGAAAAWAMRFCEILCEYLRSGNDTYALESLYIACAKKLFGLSLQSTRTSVILKNHENCAVVVAGCPVGFNVFTKSHSF